MAIEAAVSYFEYACARISSKSRPFLCGVWFVVNPQLD